MQWTGLCRFAAFGLDGRSAPRSEVLAKGLYYSRCTIEVFRERSVCALVSRLVRISFIQRSARFGHSPKGSHRS